MPTLIRLFVVLLVLAGLALAGMLALTVLVNPEPREIRVRIPAREMGVESNANSDPLGIRRERQPQPVPQVTAPAEEVEAPAAEADTTTVELPPE